MTGYVGGAGVASSTGAAGLSSSVLGFELDAGNTTAACLRYGNATLTNFSGNDWVSSAVIGIPQVFAAVASGGSKTLSGTLDRVRISTVNGTDTFDAGTINILYE